MQPKHFSKDFTLVVIGQIISLFGNAAIRFALPLYLLNQTGSPALYGTVTALAFLPAIALSPIGGVLADRVNKRNIMVALDFFTAAVLLTFSLLLGKLDRTFLFTVTLMLLYGIAGAYQPAVQASVPALVGPECLMTANAIINIIGSLASLLGPALGGLLYSAYGLTPVLRVCMACFLLSAIMEIFIHIPFAEQPSAGHIWRTARADFQDSIRFIRKEKPVIGTGLLIICGMNLFLSAMILVGLPYMVTEVLPLEAVQANRLYGFAEGALAAGGLAGGICAAACADRLTVQKAGNLLIACSLCVFPMGIAPVLFSSGLVCYGIITACCFAIMLFSTVFSIQMMSFVQAETPQTLIGKVIGVILTLSMCAQPLGNALYGVLFEACGGFEFAVILFAGVASLMLALQTKRIFKIIPEANNKPGVPRPSATCRRTPDSSRASVDSLPGSFR